MQKAVVRYQISTPKEQNKTKTDVKSHKAPMLQIHQAIAIKNISR
jgi:hypothetical protein